MLKYFVVLVSDTTKQMKHDGDVRHANIYVQKLVMSHEGGSQLKCLHEGAAVELHPHVTFQLRDVYISISDITIMLHLYSVHCRWK